MPGEQCFDKVLEIIINKNMEPERKPHFKVFTCREGYSAPTTTFLGRSKSPGRKQRGFSKSENHVLLNNQSINRQLLMSKLCELLLKMGKTENLTVTVTCLKKFEPCTQIKWIVCQIVLAVLELKVYSRRAVTSNKSLVRQTIQLARE